MLIKPLKETISKTEEDTRLIASKLAKLIDKQDIILFYGDVGAGKTYFIRALIRELYQDEAFEVTSPTFTLVNVYDQQDPHIWHFDLYRINIEEEIFELGWDEAQTSHLMLVEWAEKLESYIPNHALSIKFEIKQENRCISFYGDEDWAKRIKVL